MGWTLVIMGALIAAVGLVLVAFQALGLGKLPGDIFVQKGNVTFFFPLVTCIVISIALTVILNLFKR